MTTRKEKEEQLLALAELISKLCAGEKCINEAHVSARVNRRDANTYSSGDITRALKKLVEQGVVEKLPVAGDVWKFNNEKIIEIKPKPSPVKVIEKPVAISSILPRCIHWSKVIDEEVARLKLQDTRVENIRLHLIEKFNFRTTEKSIAHRMTFLRRCGLLPETSKHKPRKKWTKEMHDDLALYYSQGLRIDDCAIRLSKKYKREVTYCAVNSQLHSLRMNGKIRLAA
jgi:hypothetical protein